MTYQPEVWGYRPGVTVTEDTFADVTTHRLGLAWLYAECDVVEDWGAGMAFGRQLCPPGKTYRAIDGSPQAGPYIDQVCALLEWHPDPRPDGIFMRHVLEHNLAWRELLAHAVATFGKRLCVVLFTPLSAGPTHPLRTVSDGIHDLSFDSDELLAVIRDSGRDLSIRIEPLHTDTQYEVEHVIYVEPAEPG